jgi:exopolysaccharide biosynthesis operon protein EpsL
MQESAPKSARIRNRSRIVCRGFFPAAVCALAAALLAQPVAAQDRPITLRLNTSIMWDANVFRVPDSAPDPQLAQGIPGKSDRIATTTLGLRIDKAYAQQRFELDASQTATRYANFTSLDRDAFQYHGAWLWSLSPRITGTLSADRAESLIPFTDLTTPVPNVRVTDTQTFNLDGWMFGGWHVLAGAINTDVKTSQVFLAQPSYNTNAAEVGLKYVARSGNSITAITRSTRGTNPGQAVDPVNFIDNEFTVHENELKAAWKVSGKSTLNGRLARLERRNEHLPQRDFSGTTGELGYIRAVDGKLLLNFSASRNILPWTEDTQASYRIDDKLSFAPSLQIGERITLRMSAYRLVSDFRGPVAPLTGPSRRDTLRSAQLALDWSPPVRNLLLTGSVQRERRSSNTAGLDFEDTIAMLSASLAF